MPKIRTSRLVNRVQGDGLEALSREELLSEGYAAGLPGIAVGWRDATIIRKIRKIRHGA